jgi:enolase
VSHVNGEIAKALVGSDLDQRTLDTRLVELDGTSNKGRLGANALLGVSMAAVRAFAASERRPLYEVFAKLAGSGSLVLPVPMMNT